MRTFVVLCLVAVAAAQYNYNPQTSVTIDGGVGVRSGDLSGGNNGGVVASVSNDYDKEFFTFSAPEADFVDNTAAEKIAGALKKNLRVVFIKGPENTGLENAVVQLAKSASQDRTAIYVLNKQADIGELANKLNTLNTNANSKPEVHFVKYRTQADAENAQRTIQAQYDALPGTSKSANGGNAGVLDFASKVTVRSNAGSKGDVATTATSNSYLPPQSSYLPPGRNF
ncbi:uncharacterized protein LOC133337103 [Musca vetustissima]|uniref:uncharacterized protein LOC133337103 n=1 Tax=Musca vetustissima TaxID=27455 RepID=UPI002AB7817E|nr:uncharacterized protein LOC133337103 [Musca vetustissima]